jgi:uncharacterized protein
MLKERIEQDLKSALRAGDVVKLSVLRSLKSAITYAEVAKGVKGGEGLSDDAIVEVLVKEAKKRKESADVYSKVGADDRSQAELNEKGIIENYLPKSISQSELTAVVDDVVKSVGPVTPTNMGQIIGEIKRRAGPTADGSAIAMLVKERVKR